ncbi:hypothetical protein AVEN_269061-1 [Araneus ventricosus]|uniref:Uncharacterized protein n=1 Tax=Araneus ventricosus TaxID=182803 RepID=A0A4Y2JF70_ARAVE|nr:hypothetical protein AVEN_269061-1 [Araneus ventricosus]
MPACRSACEHDTSKFQRATVTLIVILKLLRWLDGSMIRQNWTSIRGLSPPCSWCNDHRSLSSVQTVRSGDIGECPYGRGNPFHKDIKYQGTAWDHFPSRSFDTRSSFRVSGHMSRMGKPTNPEENRDKFFVEKS